MLNPDKVRNHFPSLSIKNNKGDKIKVKVLEIKTSEYPPPILKGRRLRLRYITQIKSRPPNFLIFSSSLDVPKNYRRFLLNNIREQFNLKNIPIRLKFKVGNNPYV